VQDEGGSNLKQIEVWRAFDNNPKNGIPDPAEWGSAPICTKTGGLPKCTQNQNFSTSSTDSDFHTDTTLSASGVYWYGLHVLDKADNMGKESTPPKVQVDKDRPTALIDAPNNVEWLRATSVSNHHFLRTTDEDLESVIDGNRCTFEVCSHEPNGTEHCKGTVVRQCNIQDNITEITVGPGNQCDQQGRNACDIFVSAVDVAGNAVESFKSYNVDWTFPQTGKLYITPNEQDQTFPIRVVEDNSMTYRVHATDNLELSFCELFLNNVKKGNMTRQHACLSDCVFELGETIPSGGTFQNNFARCFDVSSLRAQGESVIVEVSTLAVNLQAIPPQGSIHTKFDLKATVSGNTTGNINYQFDCNTNLAPTWDFEIDNINLSTSDTDWVTRKGEKTKITAPDTFVVQDLCQYPDQSSLPHTYTAKVKVERGVGTKEGTVPILVRANSIPSATSLSVDPDNPTDYCTTLIGFPPVRVRWTFFDTDPGDTQKAYEIEVFQGATKVVDTGKRLDPTGLTRSYVFQSTGEQLLWNTAYTWQVRVWDSPNDDVSTFASGPEPFTTPKHHYPVPNFVWTPAVPSAQESVQFTDQTNFAAGGVNNSQPSINRTWSWTFGDGGSSTSQSPSHTYAQTGAFGVTLQAGDDVGSCSNPVPVNVNVTIPFPEWQEISHF
jgi:hypothetical protein